MIRSLSFVVIIACFSFTASAQFIHSIEYKAGVSVSALEWNLSNTLVASNLFPADYIGLTTAFNIKFLNHKYWNLCTQIGYTQCGGSTTLTYTDITGIPLGEMTVHERMDYLNLTALFEVKYPIRKLTPSFKIGPHLDYLSSAFTYADNFNRFNYGLDIGGGIAFTLNEHLFLSADYNYYWFYNKIRTSKLEVSITKNVSLMLGIGYKF